MKEHVKVVLLGVLLSVAFVALTVSYAKIDTKRAIVYGAGACLSVLCTIKLFSRRA